MISRPSDLLALLLAATAATLLHLAPATAEAQLIERDGGRIVVRWDDGCVARFDAEGRALSTEPDCSARQRSRAEKMVRRHLRTADSGSSGGGGDGGRAGFGGLELVSRGGGSEAVYGDGCRVFYDENGRRTDSNRICTPEHVERADRRLQQVWTKPSGAGRPIGKPIVNDRSSYFTQMLFPDGCNVNYDGAGSFTGTSGPCTRAHRDRADQEMRARR